jgi:hypothetical protein
VGACICAREDFGAATATAKPAASKIPAQLKIPALRLP